MSKIAVITGTSQGIGHGIATVFLRNGWTVIGVDRQPAQQELARQSTYSHLETDLTEPGQLRAVIDNCVEKHGHFQTLVNNAGLGNGQPFMKTTDDDYDRFYAINVRAPLTLSRAAVPILKRTQGSIVNIASAFGLVGVAQSAAYVPTKAALIGITTSMATEFGVDGIRVNAVAPGLVNSPATAQRIASNEWWHRMMIEGAPLGRAGQPEEIGEACLFLASPAASFITGVVLPVDGGWSAAKFLPDPATHFAG